MGEGLSLLCLLSFPLAGSFAQLLLGFDGGGGDGRGVVVVVVIGGQGRTEEQVAHPTLHQGKWRTVGVSGRHEHLGHKNKKFSFSQDSFNETFWEN